MTTTNKQELIQKWYNNPDRAKAHICRVVYATASEYRAELLYYEPSNYKWYRPKEFDEREEVGYALTIYTPTGPGYDIVNIQILTKYA